MDTLYDLLGALPDDNAEELRIAFRRAVKGAHPDINPGDPNAALKFRQIVRANDILTDDEQRAAYDHLLDLAKLEQDQGSKHAAASKVYKVASSVVALAVASIVAVGGYGLFTQISQATVAPAAEMKVAALMPNEIVASPSAAQDAAGAAPAQADKPVNSSDAIVPISVTTETIAAERPPAMIGPPLDLAPRDAKSYHVHGMLAYRVGDLHRAMSDFNEAIRLNPKFAEAYVDRGIVLYRMKKFERAFADLNHAKRLETAGHAKAATAKKSPAAPKAAANRGFYDNSRVAFVNK